MAGKTKISKAERTKYSMLGSKKKKVSKAVKKDKKEYLTVYTNLTVISSSLAERNVFRKNVNQMYKIMSEEPKYKGKLQVLYESIAEVVAKKMNLKIEKRK